MKKTAKRIIALSFLILTVSPAQSQVLMALIFGDKLNNGNLTFGVCLGQNWSMLGDYNGSKAKPGFAAGLHFAWKVNPKFYLQGEAMASYQCGGDHLPKSSLGNPSIDSIYADATVSRKINYVGLIATPRYHFYKSIFVEGGVVINLRTNKVYEEYTVESGDVTQTHNEKLSEGVSRFDAGAIGGVGCVLKNGEGLKFGVRYYYGLVDVFQNDAGMNNNTNFSVFGAIPVGRNKAKAKAAEKAKQ
jgi:hypothetical protein